LRTIINLTKINLTKINSTKINSTKINSTKIILTEGDPGKRDQLSGNNSFRACLQA
jgi:hypothetical protein